MYIYTCAAANAAQEQSDTILGKLDQATLALESLPQCGNVPPELEIMDITRYREIYAHPWRRIYEVLEAVVHVHWVFDSRCNVTGSLRKKYCGGRATPITSNPL